MKQGLRLLVKPGTFFNQLQWSSHHWFILIGFLIASAVETQLGSGNGVFQWYANFLTLRFGIGLGTALWIVTALRLLFLLTGAWAITQLVWIAGTLLGHRSSRRVLFRRLAIVFAILLAAYTSQHLSVEYEYGSLLALALYAWGMALGYFAISEQFGLTKLQTLAVAIFAAIVISQGWKFSTEVLRVKAEKTHSELTHKQSRQPRYR